MRKGMVKSIAYPAAIQPESPRHMDREKTGVDFRAGPFPGNVTRLANNLT